MACGLGRFFLDFIKIIILRYMDTSKNITSIRVLSPKNSRFIVKTPVYSMDCFIVAAGWIADIVIPLLSGQFTSRFDGSTKEEEEDEGDTGSIMKLLKVGLVSHKFSGRGMMWEREGDVEK